MTESGNEETLFARALELPEAERSAFLDQACGDNAELRSSIQLLLRAHGVADVYLPKMGDDGGPAARVTGQVEEQPGDWIGRYKLLQKIGEGGCGIVYMAEQEEPVRRRVALKVIKLGMDTKAVIARFDAERQALAMMDHANIAKVFDAGSTESGRPFFVMELVRGIPVTKYCDENGLSTEKRLELFSRICHAIQHAHQKGIIHRDIKPSNILVTLHDGLPTPKVIDFGIAKATQGKLTDQTLFTAFEQFIGTPAYMSPEQAEMSGLDIDTRSDVYSLGVLLYELLAGRQPFDPKTFVAAGLDEMRRVIREVDPPKPSTRLSTLADADQTTVAKLRGTAPAELSTVLAGDLDWIVMRCLEKDRTRRYATPSELVADIQRHLNNEPVIARPPSTGYLLRKLIRRHKLGFAAGAAVAISLIAGLVTSSVLLVREHAALGRAVAAETTESRLRREADANAIQARSAAANSTQIARFMTDMLKGVGPSVARGRDTELLRDILDTTVNRLDTELRDQPAVAADLRDTLGAVYLELGQRAAAETLLRAAVEARRTVSGNESAETAASLTLLGRALQLLNKSAEADAVLKEALAIRRKLFGNEHPLVADTLAELAELHAYQRKTVADWRILLEEVLAIRRKAYGNEHPAIADALSALGAEAIWEGDYVKAARLYAEALTMRRRLLGNDHPAVAASLGALASAYARDPDRNPTATAVFGDSFMLSRKLFGDQHPDTVISLLRFTGQKSARDISPATVAAVREVVANQRKLLSSGSPLMAPSLLVLASLEDLPDRNPAEAPALVREARALLDESHLVGTPFHRGVVNAMWFFAWSKFAWNAPAEGLVMGEESVKLAGSAESGEFIMSRHALAWIYVSLGRQREAATLFEALLPPCRTRYGAGFSITLVDTSALGAAYRTAGRLDKSHELLATTLASFEAKTSMATHNPHIAVVQREFGLTLVREGRYAEAEAILRQALSEYDRFELAPLSKRLCPRAGVVCGIGLALTGEGKYAEAEPLLLQAYEELQANHSRLAGNATAMTREALDALVELYSAWAETDPSKKPMVSTWRKTLEDFDDGHAQQAALPANKT